MVRPFLLFGSGLCCCRTVTELVGADMVKGIDGISYLPLLTGNGEVSRSHEYIYYEFYEQRKAVDSERWVETGSIKYVETGKVERRVILSSG